MKIPEECFEPIRFDYQRENTRLVKVDAIAKAAVVALLKELDSRGVEFGDEYSLADLADEVEAAPTGYLLDPEAEV